MSGVECLRRSGRQNEVEYNTGERLQSKNIRIERTNTSSDGVCWIYVSASNVQN
jgi:hypothetical protein